MSHSVIKNKESWTTMATEKTRTSKVKQGIVDISQLSKIYTMGQEKVAALAGLDLTIYKGEICCLFGPSGSGKSTLLNMIAGLEKPTKGEIFIGKYPIHEMKEKQVTLFRQKHIGFIFQSYNLIPTLSALENVSLPLIFKGVPPKQRNAMAKKVLEQVGLGNRLYHKPNEMSGGQQQRVSIARAFVGSPKIIFADEPTGNLDTKTTVEVLELMRSIVEENGQTMIIVSHDLEIKEFADRIVHMRDGKIEKIDIMKTEGRDRK